MKRQAYAVQKELDAFKEAYGADPDASKEQAVRGAVFMIYDKETGAMVEAAGGGRIGENI